MFQWSLSNYFRKIGYNQFMNIGRDFHKACEQDFGKKCEVEVRLFSQPKCITSVIVDDDTAQKIEAINHRNEIIKTTAPKDLTKTQWDKASYAELTVRPIDADSRQEPNIAKFKGHLPRTVTFYMQGAENTLEAAKTLHHKHKWKIFGNGLKNHEDNYFHAFMATTASQGYTSLQTARALNYINKHYDL